MQLDRYGPTYFISYKTGVCQCQTGFAAMDCSIDLTAPPVVTGLARDGQCDVETRECLAIPIYGTNFLETNNLTCKITAMKVY